MRVYHPNAVRETDDDVDGAVDVGGEVVSVADDDTLDVSRAQAERLADRYGLDVQTIQVDESADAPSDAAESDGDTDAETCDTVMNNGEVCGRELPCPYHS